MRNFLLSALLLMMYLPALAQDDDDQYVNFGFNIGWSLASPQFTTMNAFKERFDAETGFSHQPMELGTLSNGGTLGFTYFAGNCFVDFEYRALAITGKYRMQPKPTEQEQGYTFKINQHTGRFSYNYGKSFGKHGTSGIYLGGAVYGGTWGLKTKEDGRKMNRVNMDDYHGFTVGVSPQLTFRTYIFELKGYYDFPFIQTDIAPVYNKMFSGVGASDASGDAKLKGRMGHAGVSISFFIPFGKPSPRSVDNHKSSHQQLEVQSYKMPEKSDSQKSKERIEDMQRDQERRERQFNDKFRR